VAKNWETEVMVSMGSIRLLKQCFNNWNRPAMSRKLGLWSCSFWSRILDLDLFILSNWVCLYFGKGMNDLQKILPLKQAPSSLQKPRIGSAAWKRLPMGSPTSKPPSARWSSSAPPHPWATPNLGWACVHHSLVAVELRGCQTALRLSARCLCRLGCTSTCGLWSPARCSDVWERGHYHQLIIM
jgi:hypothetical protein